MAGVQQRFELIEQLGALLVEHTDKTPLLAQPGPLIYPLVGHFVRMRDQVLGNAVSADLVGGVSF